MTLGVLVLQLGDSPHLPVLADDDHEETLLGLLDCLSREYDAEPVVMKSAHTSTPQLLLRRLSDFSRAMRSPPETLLVLIRSYATIFEREGNEFCSIAVRDSVAGRPGSMVTITALMNSLTRSLPETHFLVLADLDLLPSSARRADAGPAAAALVALGDGAGTGADTACVGLCVRAAGGAARQRKPSLVRALDCAFRDAADAGADLPFSTLCAAAGEYLVVPGAVAFVSRTGAQDFFAPRNRSERLPDYIRADLYSPDPGSRLDAVVELADLARAGDPIAPAYLERVRSSDASADVRGYAANHLRSARSPGIQRLIDFGFLPRETMERVRGHRVMPPFTAPFVGGGTVGVDAPRGQAFEQPSHRVDIGTFRMALRPTTNLDYLVYVISTGAECPAHWASGWVFSEDLGLPVVMVSWYEARRYCRWLTETARKSGWISATEHVALPSEAEWEIAARNAGDEIHPWGSDFRSENCNVRSTGLGGVVEVGSFSPAGDSRGGCVDLIGNVWEWTSSAWGKSGRQPRHTYPYDPEDGREDPDLGADVRRVVRGGGFYYADICSNSYTRNRVAPEDRHPAGGFRVVMR